MTRKDYKLIAQALNQGYKYLLMLPKGYARNMLLAFLEINLQELCERLEKENQKFDSEKFKDAVYKVEKVKNKK